ncbi:fatty acid desaturase, partial [Dryocola clanedunensis]
SRMTDGVSQATTLERVLPGTATASQSTVARATLRNDDGQWRPGAAVKARIVVATTPAAQVVPLSALQTMDGKDVVFVREGETYTARAVTLGARDARYIRRVVAAVRWTGVAGRALLFLGAFVHSVLIPAWIAGVVMLALSKILENMELAHNVIHGQYDWMGDPQLQGSTYEWDIVGTADNWRKTHNFRHHTYTNVRGLDDDIGYGLLRIFPEQRWRPFYLMQPVVAVGVAWAATGARSNRHWACAWPMPPPPMRRCMARPVATPPAAACRRCQPKVVCRSRRPTVAYPRWAMRSRSCMASTFSPRMPKA